MAEGPVRTRLANQEHPPLALGLGRSHDETGTLEDLELDVDRRDSRRVAKIGSEVADAGDSIAVGDRRADLDPILRAAKQRVRPAAHRFSCLGIRHGIYLLRTMDRGPLTILLGQMIAAGGVRCLPSRTPWPMHRAVRELYEHAGRVGRLAQLPEYPRLRPCPERGLAVEGLDGALRELVGAGLLVEVGDRRSAMLAVSEDALVRWRRGLLGSDARRVALLQRAGSRWAALSSMDENTAAKPTASAALMRASGTA